MKQVEVIGMSCAHCVAAVTGALEALGLKEVSVSLETGLATFAPAQLDQGALRAALDDIGFEVGEMV